jgi:WD40 repeat protein
VRIARWRPPIPSRRTRSLGTPARPWTAITELEDALATGKAGDLQLYEKLTGSKRLWWRCCRDAVQSQPYWLQHGDHDKALQVISGTEMVTSGGAVSRAAEAADLVCRALAGPAGSAGSASALSGVIARAAERWDSSPAVLAEDEQVFAPDKAVASASPSLRDRVREVLACLDGIGTDAGQAMLAICALLLAAERPDAGRVVRVPVVFARPGTSKGAAGTLELREFAAGPAGLFPDPRGMRNRRADPAFDASLTLAWQFATGADGGRCVLWHLTLDKGAPDHAIDGGSLGAAFAVALRELLRRRRGSRPGLLAVPRAYFIGLRPGCAITGVLATQRPAAYDQLTARAADGPWLDKVGDMDAKLDAAKTKGFRLVAPAANRDSARPGTAVPVDWAETIHQADRFARRVRPVRTAMAVAAVLVIVGISASIGVFVNFDNTVRAATDQVVAARQQAMSQQAASDAASLATSNPDLAKQLAVAAYRIAPTSAAYSSLFASQSYPGTISAPGTTQAAFSGDGSLLALVGGPQVTVWSLTAHAIVATLPRGVLATSVTFRSAPRGTGGLLAVGESNGQVEFWTITYQRGAVHVGLAAATTGSAGPVEQVAFSPDGTILASAGGGHSVRLWSVDGLGRPEPLAVLSAGTSTASSVAFADGGGMLVTGDWDQTVRFWNVASRRKPVLMATIPGGQLVRALAVDPASQMLAIGGDGGDTDPTDSLQLWDISNPRSPRRLADPADTSPVTAVAFSATSSVLMASGPHDDLTSLWDLSKPAHPVALPSLDGGGQYLALSPGGQLMATGDSSGDEVGIWNVADPEYREASAAVSGASNGPGAIAPDGRLLAMSNQTGTAVQLEDIADPAHPVPVGQVPDDLLGEVSFAYHDGRLLMATAGKYAIMLWDVTDPSRTSLVTQIATNAVVSDIALSPDGDTVAALLLPGLAAVVHGGPGTVGLWSIRNPRDAVPLPSLSDAPLDQGAEPGGGGLAFGRGGQTLMEWAEQPSNVNQVVLWDLRPGAKPTPIPGVPSEISGAVAVALSPTAPVLAAADASGTVHLWNVADPTHPLFMATLAGTTAQQQILMFSPDGGELIGEDAQDTVYLWNARDSWSVMTAGTLPAWMTGSGSASPGLGGLSSVTALGTPEGGRVLVNDDASSGNDLVTIDPSAIISRVCAQVGDPITKAQWQQYLPGSPYRPPCPAAG